MCATLIYPGIDSISFESHLGMLTVAGMVEPTTIIKKLKKSSIQAQPWEVRAAAPMVSMVHSSVEEAAAPSQNSAWGRICCLPAAACARFSSKHDLTNTSRITETVTTSEPASQ